MSYLFHGTQVLLTVVSNAKETTKLQHTSGEYLSKAAQFIGETKSLRVSVVCIYVLPQDTEVQDIVLSAIQR